MDRQQFLLRLDPDCGERALFELRYSDDERLFHVSFRPRQRRVVVNDMRAGQWGQERWYDLPDGFRSSDPVLCHREGPVVLVLLEGLRIRFDIPPGRLGRADLLSAGTRLTAQWLPPVRVARIETAAAPGPDGAGPNDTGPDTCAAGAQPPSGGRQGPGRETGRIVAVPLAGGELHIPSSLPPSGLPPSGLPPSGLPGADTPELASDLASDLGLELHFGQLEAVPDYLRFMAAQLVARRADAVIADSVRARTAALALAHARLLPSHQVHLLCTDPARAATIAAIARHNRLDNLHLHLPPAPYVDPYVDPYGSGESGPETGPEAPAQAAPETTLPGALHAPVRLIVTSEDHHAGPACTPADAGADAGADAAPGGGARPGDPQAGAQGGPEKGPEKGPERERESWTVAIIARCAAQARGTNVRLHCYGALPRHPGLVARMAGRMIAGLPAPAVSGAPTPRPVALVAATSDPQLRTAPLRNDAAQRQTAPARPPATRTGSAPARPRTMPALQPGLDVVVALHNTLPHVIACIDSLLQGANEGSSTGSSTGSDAGPPKTRQGHGDRPQRGSGGLRILVVDDGSTDGSGAQVAMRFGTDPRVRLLQKPNGGCASARNYGRLVSDRTHIAFVDADDFTDPGFFAGLYGLAMETGTPMVQGGFDFHDPRRSPPDSPYGGDLVIGTMPAQRIGGQQAIEVPVSDALLRSQPSIWRRVYRRDFLDRHDIWFPESIRAYDDYLFQILCFSHVRHIWFLPGPKYRYRQHQDQDTRQSDARHFNMLAMFSMLSRRAAAGDWSSFDAHVQTMLDAINWSSTRLQPALVGVFLREAARLCVALTRIWGAQILPPARLATVRHPDFAWLVAAETARVADLPDGRWWAETETALAHPDTVHLHLALKTHL